MSRRQRGPCMLPPHALARGGRSRQFSTDERAEDSRASRCRQAGLPLATLAAQRKRHRESVAWERSRMA